LSEKVGTLEPQYKLVKQSNKKKKQNKNINLAMVESSKEDEIIESQEETLLLGTNWFDKSHAKLDFDKNTVSVWYLGKQVTVNTTHVSNNSLLQELEEFTDEEDWIDELENNNEVQKVFFSNNTSSEEDNLFYNPWSDNNPAIYLADSSESLLNKNTHVFTQKISKDEQTVVLGQTDL
ncbi:25723_t:CDS:2, partial [Gigaspora margarita]